LLDVLEGDSTLSIRADEAEESWRIVEPILKGLGRWTDPTRRVPGGFGGPDAMT
jgi:glucose-6-phosphate 1-dehydrogenase